MLYKSSRGPRFPENREGNNNHSKPYACSFCPTSFVGRTDLERHILIHTGEKPFKCPHCPYQCIRKWNLKSHMKIHTGEKPFCCQHCDFKTSHKSNMEWHLVSKHKPN